MFLKSLYRLGAVIGCLSILSTVQAGIVISGTRVVYPSDQKTVTVQVRNEGANAVLMQTWIDDGDADRAPDEIDVPFIIMPPVSRVEAHTGQSINISYVPREMPQDRESVYWLNVLDIPAKPEKTDEMAGNALIQVAVRSRIKMFYRPEPLKKGAIDAPKQLEWARRGEGMSVKNPTPYYINISSLQVNSGEEEKLEFLSEGLMLEPFAEQQVNIKGFNYTQFTVLNINDYGGLIPVEVQLNH